MPEGHSIHRQARDQTPMLRRKLLQVSSPQGRFLEGAALLDGRRCMSVEAYGKHLIYRFAGGDALHIHLGLFGQFSCGAGPAGEPRGLVRVRLESPSHVVDCNGPNCCEILDVAQVAALLARIGPDVLRDDADPQRAWARITRSRAPIGQLVMDQSVMAGIGNIYRAEILWRQRIHPLTPGRALRRDEFDAFWADSAALLRVGVEHQAIITADDVLADLASGTPARRGRGRYGARTNIFKKKTCPRCGGPIRQFAIAARKVFSCDACQPAVDPVALKSVAAGPTQASEAIEDSEDEVEDAA